MLALSFIRKQETDEDLTALVLLVIIFVVIHVNYNSVYSINVLIEISWYNYFITDKTINVKAFFSI